MITVRVSFPLFFPVVLLAVLFAGCVGPAASDAELCRDVITRLCHAPLCDEAQRSLSVDAGVCEETLLAQTGCGAAEFSFSTPSRQRVLECRAPMALESSSRSEKPTCEAVFEALRCLDLLAFLKGALK